MQHYIRNDDELFDYNKLTHTIWLKLSERLRQEIVKNKEDEKKGKRYINSENKTSKGINIETKQDNEFDGIINSIKNNMKNDVFYELNFVFYVMKEFILTPESINKDHFYEIDSFFDVFFSIDLGSEKLQQFGNCRMQLFKIKWNN